MNLHDLTNRIAVDAVQLDIEAHVALVEIVDSLRGQPKGQHFEPVTGGSTVLWCWEHEREVQQCERRDLDCDGETIEVHDPTGEAGADSAMGLDQARTDERDLTRHVNAAATALEKALRICGRYKAVKVTLDRAGIGTCSDCPTYCDGKEKRLVMMRGGDPVCPACRSKRERAKSPCQSAVTKDMVQHRCERPEHVTGNHRGGGFEWNATGLIQAVA